MLVSARNDTRNRYRASGVVWSVAGFFILAYIALAGCGRSEATVPVSGRVTVGGSPVENIIVTFTPRGDAAELGRGSFGRTDADGHYTLTLAGTDEKGAVVGRHAVTFAFRDEASFNMSEDELAQSIAAGDILDAGLPAKARDGSMEFVVKPGGTEAANFDF